ncbi:MAG: hypothetical protein AAB953_00955 [Patescibacteria group bacterium]
MKKSILLFSVLILFVACSGAPKFKAGDIVLADWYQDNWHLGKLGAECNEGSGWTVDFNDSFYDSAEGQESTCYTMDKIVANTPPAADKIKVGDVVLGEWVEDAYYSAKVDKIEGDKYSIKFVSDGWESQVTLDKLRLVPEKKVEEKKDSE